MIVNENIVLTCAHNLYSFEHKLYYEDIEFYPGQNGKYMRKIKVGVANIRIHPNFYEYETSEHEHYDYGIIILK